MQFSNRITKYKVLHLSLFEWLSRRFKKNVTFFGLNMTARFKGDHAPKFSIDLIIINVIILEISFYDTRHKT